MPSSTRKWRKRQKEYNRRKRQATRRQEQRNRNREEQERQDRISLALGVTSAQGYNKNVLPKAIGLSKTTQSNYLTTILRKKRLDDKMKIFFKNYDEEHYRNKLWYAIQKEDPFVVRYLLEKGEIDIHQPNLFGQTPLQMALSRLQSVLQTKVTGRMEYHRQFQQELDKKQKNIDTLLKIIDLLVKGGATLSPNVLIAFWETGAFIETFLQSYPQLKQLSFAHKDEILKELQRTLDSTQDEIQEERGEFHRGWGYGFVPRYLRDREELEEYSLETFKAFRRTYNPATGQYTLRDEENANENQKQYEYQNENYNE
jgi:hypothetical protein